jgi:DNA-binding NarL/FixJ family response regulator
MATRIVQLAEFAEVAHRVGGIDAAVALAERRRATQFDPVLVDTQAMREPRPYREPRPADDAAAELRADVRSGRLEADAVEAVLAAGGHRVVRRREGPAGLTPREVQVLRLVACGLSNKEIAERLVIAPKTTGNHIEYIYTKIGTSNRAAASMFAMQHGLLPEEGFSTAD